MKAERSKFSKRNKSNEKKLINLIKMRSVITIVNISSTFSAVTRQTYYLDKIKRGGVFMK